MNSSISFLKMAARSVLPRMFGGLRFAESIYGLPAFLQQESRRENSRVLGSDSDLQKRETRFKTELRALGKAGLPRDIA